jgi:hypothetical protein
MILRPRSPVTKRLRHMIRMGDVIACLQQRVFVGFQYAALCSSGSYSRAFFVVESRTKATELQWNRASWWILSVEQSMEWELAGETEVLPQCHFVHNCHVTWEGLNPGRRGGEQTLLQAAVTVCTAQRNMQEALVTCCTWLSAFVWRGWGQPWTIYVMLQGVSPEIRTQSLLSTTARQPAP